MLRAIIAQQGKERAKLKGKRLKDKGQRKEAAQSSKLKAER